VADNRYFLYSEGRAADFQGPWKAADVPTGFQQTEGTKDGHDIRSRRGVLIRDLIFVTCTYRRPGRLDFFRRHIRTLISRIEHYHWIVVEDGDVPDPELSVLLEGWNSRYLHIGPTRDEGGTQRNLAFECIRDLQLDGIVYNLEDDNLVLPELAQELRNLSKVGIVPIGNLGPNGVERPVVVNGQLVRWDSNWAERKYPVAKGAFAFESRLIFAAKSPIWDWRGAGGESEFIDKLIESPTELDLSPCHWNQVCLVFNKEPLQTKSAMNSASQAVQVYEDLPPASEYGLPPSQPSRLALVGCGWFACEAHIPALLQLEREGLVEVVALCARSTDSLARAGQRFGARKLKTYRQLDSLLADPAIDIVDLVLPIGTMPQAIGASLQAGKHVISEKPGAPSIAACAALFDMHSCLEDPPFWAVAENWRFKNTAKVLEQIIRSGRIGSIYLADFQFITSSSPSFYLGWRGSPDYPGGHLLDSGVHFIALLRLLVGEIARVSATVSQRRPHLPPADSITAVMRFANGAEGSLQLSFAAAAPDGRPATLTLVGAKGSLHVNLFSNIIRLRDAAREEFLKVPDDPWVQGGVVQTLAHCLRAFRHNAPLRSSPAEALRDVAVIEAMLESGQTGQAIDIAPRIPALQASSQKIASFNGIWVFRPKQKIECQTVSEVSAAVARAATAGLRVRPLGNANSWGAELVTPDVSLTVRGLNRIHEVDRARGTVTVEAGVRLGDLTRVLAAQGRALPSLPFNPHVTIGGAVATATHGTSMRWGTLSDFVVAMKIVAASGKVIELGPGSPADELAAARTSVGMLGVTVELELETTPMPWVRLSELSMDLPAFLAQRNEIMSRYAHVWGHWTLGDDRMRIEGLESRPEPKEGLHPYVLGDTGSWHALRKTPPPNSSLTVTQGNGHRVWMSMQYGVALSQIETAIACIRASEFAKKHRQLIVELKFLKASNRSLLAPNAGQDSVLFNIWWLVDERLKHEIFRDFEDTMRALDARPHWGKFHRLPEIATMMRAYPSWPAFEAVRSRFDPQGIFSIFPDHWR
jgi:predicted dehydrogenase/FAD/FMN-containing dehydrogenase